MNNSKPDLPADVRAKLEEAVDVIVELADPLLVILFGSYAEGRGDESSDLDLLVVAPTDRPVRMEAKLARALRGVIAPFDFDIILGSPEWWENTRWVRGFVAREADRKGVRLYEAAP